jgi:3-hydroxyacyl-CoA dehydrogenase
MNKNIRQVAILGSGVMGSRIACHFANIGVKTLLLDIVPKEPNAAEQAKGLTIDATIVRNRIVNDALQAVVKSNPAALYSKDKIKNITTGNFTDNMKDIANCDWILEAVVENLEIKKSVFAEVEKHRKIGSIISTNTSGIPINTMLEGRSEDFKSHFCGTHFFNPPRYLRLLEIIPTAATKPEVVGFLMKYGDLYLGKTSVLCKDTPAFIANRIGVFSIMAVLKHKQEFGFSIDEIDALTGPISGRPKSATFRTCDVVGLDTLVKVANNAYNDCVNDTARELFMIPDFINKMLENNWLGDKTKQGFYLKTKDENGKKIQSLNLDTLQYEDKKKVKFDCIGVAKPIDDLKKRIKILHKGTDKGALFLQKMTLTVSAYCSLRIPEIADTIYQIDDALKAGCAWYQNPCR